MCSGSSAYEGFPGAASWGFGGAAGATRAWGGPPSIAAPTRVVALHIEVHWHATDLVPGGPTPTAFTSPPPLLTAYPSSTAVYGAGLGGSGGSDDGGPRIVKIAVIVASLFGVLALACIAAFFCLRRRARGRRRGGGGWMGGGAGSIKSESRLALHDAPQEMGQQPPPSPPLPAAAMQSRFASHPGSRSPTTPASLSVSPWTSHASSSSQPTTMSTALTSMPTPLPAARLSVGDDPPPPYPEHERCAPLGLHTTGGTAPPRYQTPQPCGDGGEWAARTGSSRPLSTFSETTQDHALITDGWR